jgi:hypothetical protein
MDVLPPGYRFGQPESNSAGDAASGLGWVVTSFGQALVGEGEDSWSMMAGRVSSSP